MASSSTSSAQVITGSARDGATGRTVIDPRRRGSCRREQLLPLEIPLDNYGTTLTTYVDNGEPGGTYQPDTMAPGGGFRSA